MSRHVLLLATLLAGLSLCAAFTSEGHGHAAERTDELALVIDLPGQEPFQANFIIRAADDHETMETALNAALQLAPGATITPAEGAAVTREPGRVTAQWAPWGWRWDASELPVRVVYNPTGAPAGFAPADVASALSTWSNVSGSSFSYAYAGETSLTTSMDVSGPDGVNVIAWKDLACNPGCVLGVTTRSFTSHEADIVLNTNAKANLGNGENGTVDTVSVLVHESGHVLGLEHSCPIFGPCSQDEIDAVMFYAYGGEHRQLAPDDVTGLTLLYPAQQPTGVVGDALPALTVSVEEGWNLVTMPTGEIDTLVSGLSCVDAVYSLGGAGWASWVRGVPAQLQTLTASNPGTAVWVYSSATCSASIQP